MQATTKDQLIALILKDLEYFKYPIYQMKTKCQNFYFTYTFFQSALKVYIKRNVDVHVHS